MKATHIILILFSLGLIYAAYFVFTDITGMPFGFVGGLIIGGVFADIDFEHNIKPKNNKQNNV